MTDVLNGQCEGCDGARHAPLERLTFCVRTWEWYCPQCTADAQAYDEDQGRFDSARSKDNTPEPIRA